MPETEAKRESRLRAPDAEQAIGTAEQWELRRGGRLAYWGVIAPLAARLPAKLSYQVACAWGDLTFRLLPDRDADLAHLRHLRELLGDGILPEDVERFARDFWRFRACEVMDLMRLRGRARPLAKLVEIRGKEHLAGALEQGRGAILCSAHFGSYLGTFSLIHAAGFPLTNIGRWDWNYRSSLSSLERRFWDLAYARRVLRHRQRPNLEPWKGRNQVAVQAAAALRKNEVVTLCSDPAPLAADRSRAVEAPFLGRRAMLVPGVVTLAKLTGAPLLMAFAHRQDDYRHQVLEISPPVPLDDDADSVFRRCVAAMDAAIRANPRDWYFWFQRDELEGLGLLAAPTAEGRT
ncbi:MAG TPA: lysophospholipid acyltransferase family protein [Solirubrobacteraceae bacterium]|nr:lysophospholipid acyltransferase family protein [Solirubrobacteraceae bacterium]